MAKSRNPKNLLAKRRGVLPAHVYSNSWFTTVIQMPDRTGPVDLDELLDRLTERGVIGNSKREIGAALHAGRIRTPSGKWGLLVALPGQSWAYLLPSFDSDEMPAEIAKSA